MQSGVLRLAIGLGHLARVALWVAGAGLVAMTAIISAQVFFRYVLNGSIIWSEPAAVILMGWFIFLGAAVGIRDGYHLSFDVLLYLLPERGKLVLHSISDLVVAAFGTGMIWYGGELLVAAYGITLPSLGITGAIDFMPPGGGGRADGAVLAGAAGAASGGSADGALWRNRSGRGTVMDLWVLFGTFSLLWPLAPRWLSAWAWPVSPPWPIWACRRSWCSSG